MRCNQSKSLDPFTLDPFDAVRVGAPGEASQPPTGERRYIFAPLEIQLKMVWASAGWVCFNGAAGGIC